MKKSFEQFARIKRWKNLLEDLEDSGKLDSAPKYFDDVMYELFENCWHLKDWLINSSDLNQQIVKDFFHKNYYMKLCQSIAIESKHLIPNSSHVLKVRLFKKTSAEGKRIINVLTADGKVFNAFELAKKCVKECGDFLVKNKVV